MSEFSYDRLAPFYDAFQSGENPEAWARFLSGTFRALERRLGFADPQGQAGRDLAIDLGCGTGLVTQALAAEGFDVMGIDRSENMLAEAWERAWELDPDKRPFYLAQDITAFELYGTANLIYATLDTFNHLNPEELRTCFSLCHNYLHPGGALIFDLLSLDYMREEMGQQLYYEIDRDHALLWANAFDEAEKVNRASLTLFAQKGESGLYEREDMEILEYYHAPEKVTETLEDLGFKVEAAAPRPELAEALQGSRRHFVLAYKGI